MAEYVHKSRGKKCDRKKKTLGAHCAPSARPFLPTGRISSAVRAHVFWPIVNLQSLTTTTQRMRSTQQFKGRFLSFSNTYTNKLAYLNRNNSNNNNYYNNIVNKGCALCLLFSRQDKKKDKAPQVLQKCTQKERRLATMAKAVKWFV